MNTIIIDDEEMARAIIEQFTIQNKNLTLNAQFSDAIKAIKYLNQNHVDLIFLDIHMPTFSGFDLIQTLKDPPKIILTTSDRNFAIEAFEYECIIDYLVKPIGKDRFDKAVNKALAFSNPILSNLENKNRNEPDQDLYINIDRIVV